MFDNAIDTIKNKVGDALGDLNPFASKNGDPSGTAATDAETLFNSYIEGAKVGRKLWYIDAQDWYKVFGYRFSIAYVDPSKPNGNIDEALNINSGEENLGPVSWKHFTLPIPPSQLVVKPVFPSRVTSTLGGVVEETSAVKFWMVSMAGTTGTSISRLKEDQHSRVKMASKFREAIETTGLLAGVSANINSAVSKFGGIADGLINAGQSLASGDIAGALGGVTGSLNNALLPPIPYNSSAVDNRANGFTEAQELQKFFFIYNALKGKHPKNFALMFTNFKTDQSWRCVIKDFSLQQSAENPYLYRYSISLQCWDVRASKDLFGSSSRASFDRFAPGGDLGPVNTLSAKQMFSGLGNIATKFGI